MKPLSEIKIADGYAPGEGVDAVKDIVDDTIEIMSKGNDAYVKY